MHANKRLSTFPLTAKIPLNHKKFNIVTTQYGLNKTSFMFRNVLVNFVVASDVRLL